MSGSEPGGNASCNDNLKSPEPVLSLASGPGLYRRTARFRSGRKPTQASHFMSELLDAASIKTYMKKVPEWETDKKKIERVFEFDDFTAAMDFVNLVAEISEEQEHHPDIDIRYNRVKLAIFTQTKDGLTELDFQLAERIDTLSEE
jgi:4a-hydroxytetrahydrobiopterin dehydratase